MTTDSSHGLPVYPNLLKDVKITGLNQHVKERNPYDNAFAFKATGFEVLREGLTRTPLQNIQQGKRFQNCDVDDLVIHTAHLIMS